MSAKKISKKPVDRGSEFLEECEKLKEENEKFLETVYKIAYRTEKKVSGNEKKAKDLAKRVRFRMEHELNQYFSKPPELLAG
jgi:hypothetical protein